MEANERKQNRELEAQKRKVLIEENKVRKGVEEKHDSLESDEKNRARRVLG